MKVYKFGGASVRSAEGVKNLCSIVKRDAGQRLVVIVSAMGKTTNALEKIVAGAVEGREQEALAILQEVEAYHAGICAELFGEMPPQVAEHFAALGYQIRKAAEEKGDYDLWYDRVVSMGEIVSTAIIAQALKDEGVEAVWLDMRRIMVTDDRHRDANVDMELTAPLLKAATREGAGTVFVGQGFIGADKRQEPTTLGREGSDYTAAVVANLLDAESLTIWKDVEGVLSADPKIFPETTFIPELTYLDAIELAYSGAQIIHPKTIKPLHNKRIPLYVKPFGDPDKQGSVIKYEMQGTIKAPILILKRGQVLVSVRPKDFSFVLEERIGEIVSAFEQRRVKVNLVQSSAVNLTLCVNNDRNLPGVLQKLREVYRVVTNTDCELLTIRGFDEELYLKYALGTDVLVVQRTRRILRLVRRTQTEA